MTVATWQANHAYVLGNLVNPTVANGHSFMCTTAGTSGNAEPSWSGRWPAVQDGTAYWAPYTPITPQQLRSQMNWGDTAPTNGQYTDDILGNYLLAAVSSLEKATSRYLVNRPGATVTMTSMIRAILPIPGLRTPSSVTYAANLLTSAGYWLLPDDQQSGVSTGIQFRALRVGSGPGIQGTPYGPWVTYGNPSWFDLAADSPFFPPNYGGGYAFSSMPNDTIIIGDWGWEPGFEPMEFVHALGVLGAFFGMRPPALLADSAITPQGGIVSYASMPAEVQRFVQGWRTGAQVVSIG